MELINLLIKDYEGPWYQLDETNKAVALKVNAQYYDLEYFTNILIEHIITSNNDTRDIISLLWKCYDYQFLVERTSLDEFISMLLLNEYKLTTSKSIQDIAEYGFVIDREYREECATEFKRILRSMFRSYTIDELYANSSINKETFRVSLYNKYVEDALEGTKDAHDLYSLNNDSRHLVEYNKLSFDKLELLLNSMVNQAETIDEILGCVLLVSVIKRYIDDVI